MTYDQGRISKSCGLRSSGIGSGWPGGAWYRQVVGSTPTAGSSELVGLEARRRSVGDITVRGPVAHPRSSYCPQPSLDSVRSRNRSTIDPGNMRNVRAGALYFALAFAAGWVLGPIRELLVIPRFGRLVGNLFEVPLMLIVIVAAARWVVRRLVVPPALKTRATIGLVAHPRPPPKRTS